MLAYLINLDTSVERLENSKSGLSKIALHFERVSAVDGAGLNLGETELYSPSHSQSRIARQLSGGEVGCFLSHLHCLKRFLATDAQTCLIMEDDLEFDPNAGTLIADTNAWALADAGAHADLVHLSHPVRKMHKAIPTPSHTLNGAGFCYAPYFPITTGAILWSRTGARAFLDDVKFMDAPFDEYLQAWCARRGRGYGFCKPLMRQMKTKSLIEDEREIAKQLRGAIGPLIRVFNRAPIYVHAMRHRLRYTAPVNEPRLVQAPPSH